MAVIQHGWSTPAQASLYFTDERQVTALWDALAGDDAKNKALNTAYNRIYYSKEFDVPAKGAETAAQLVILIKAQSEMTYYILMHLEDEDRRMGLEAQAVTTAGIVKEVYDKDRAGDVPIPPIVEALLEDFSTIKAFGMADLDRDEDESVHTKVDDF